MATDPTTAVRATDAPPSGRPATVDRPQAAALPAVPAPPPHPVSAMALVLAFAAIYIVWGSTYLGIRYALDSIPPFMLAGTRFSSAGVLIFIWARLRGAAAPTRKEWLGAAQVGIALLVGGNGLVCWAEQVVPSGQAALQIGTVPLWIVLLNWLFGDRKRPTLLVFLGIIAGFSGIVLLNAPALRSNSGVSLGGGAAIILACLFWSAGSVRARYVALPKSNAMATALEMMIASVVLIAIAIGRGELASWRPSQVTLPSALAMVYLIVFGSMVAFSAYAWLLQVCPPARVATYAYVNPVVALALGALMKHEPINLLTIEATIIILGAVALLSWRKKR